MIEHRKKKTNYRFAITTIILPLITAIFSVSQACNNWEQYQILKDSKKDTEPSKPQGNIKENNNPTGEKKNKLENGMKSELINEPLPKSESHN